jgi:hypothetical protein
VKGMCDAKTLFDYSIFTQEELMRGKEILLNKRDNQSARG